MNKTQLITSLRAHLADKEDIANEAAPALALMRYAVVELEKPTSGQVSTAEVDELRKELNAADSTIEQLRDAVSDHEGILYSLLADLGMVPEVDDEPVDSLAEAVERVPNLLDDLQMKVSSLYADTGDGESDKDRFIAGVRNLLEPIAAQGAQLLSLQEMWDLLEAASDNYANFLNAFPGFYTMLGAHSEMPGTSGNHHNPTFCLNEDCIKLGIAFMAEYAFAFLK